MPDRKPIGGAAHGPALSELWITLKTLPQHPSMLLFLVARMQHLPRIGEKCHWSGWEFEILDLDARRIDKVLATRLDKPQ